MISDIGIDRRTGHLEAPKVDDLPSEVTFVTIFSCEKYRILATALAGMWGCEHNE
jgi:hypothetical protein